VSHVRPDNEGLVQLREAGAKAGGGCNRTKYTYFHSLMVAKTSSPRFTYLSQHIVNRYRFRSDSGSLLTITTRIAITY
jgi:hypothetical protein